MAIGGMFTQIHPVKVEATSSNCNAKHRVTLVVDFANSKKPLVRCAENFSGTGWQLFKATGVSVSGTDQYPEGFVCRIENVPTTSQQPCNSTPTYAQGGWAYFYASLQTSGKWVFSPTGSSLRKPPCGSAEGWRYFKANESPSKSPPRVNFKPFKC